MKNLEIVLFWTLKIKIKYLIYALFRKKPPNIIWGIRRGADIANAFIIYKT